MFKGGALYLYATVDVEDKPLNESPTGWLKVDLRVVNPAVTADGETLPRPIRLPGPKGKPDHPDRQGSGAPVNSVRYKNLKLPINFNRKERTLPNDCSTSDPRKKPVSPTTSITGSPRPRVPRHPAPGAESPESNSLASAPCTVPQAPPPALHSWSFHQLGSANAYKAQRAGVPVVAHTPAYTSHSCSGCGHVHRKNRPNRDDFLCTRCASHAPADLNAAINIAMRAQMTGQ